MQGVQLDSALSGMVDEIESSVHSDQFLLGIYLDVKGAFDNLSIEAGIEVRERSPSLY